MTIASLRKSGGSVGVARSCDCLRGHGPSVGISTRAVLLKTAGHILGGVCADRGVLALRSFGPVGRVQKASRAAAMARIASLTTRWEGRLRRAFQAAVKQLKNDIDIEAIANQIASGAMDAAYKLIDDALEAHGFTLLRQEFNNAVIAGASLGASLGRDAFFGAGSTPSAVQFSFDVTNPKTVDFLQRFSGEQVAELVTEQRVLLREVLTEGFMAGDNPLTVARSIRDYVGLTARQAETVDRFTGIVANGALPDGSPATMGDYLGYELRDRRFDATVREFLENDGPALSAEKVESIAAQYARRYVDYRADTIGRTEGIRAISAGNLAVWEQADEDGRIPDDLEVRRFWVFTDDDKVRESHREIPDLNPNGVGLDEPFETPDGPLMYPGDPAGDPSNTINCRCLVLYEMRPKEL